MSALLRYEVFCTVAYLSSRLASRLIRISLFRADDSLCCLIRVEAARKQMQPSRSSIACPGLLFLNNLSRQLEWLLYEYALKIPFLCSFSPSLCMSVCAESARVRANTELCVCSTFPPETKEVSERISPPTTERPESLEMHHRFCWVAHEPRCLLPSSSFCPTPAPFPPRLLSCSNKVVGGG